MQFKQDSSPEELDLVWPKYGLRESPYSTSPMRLLGRFPMEEVFCGRANEINWLKKIITSSSSTRILVSGDFGIGKTTFVNYVRWLLAIKGGFKSNYLTINTEIKLQSGWDATKFLLSTLSAIYTSYIIFDWKSMGIKLNSIKRLKDYVSISKQRSFQGSVGVLGGGYGTSGLSPPSISPEILEDLLLKVCNELTGHGKQIIIPYNNLENIKKEELSDIFKSIRDYIQIEGLHTIFLGPPSVISALETNRQVHSTFSRPLVLEHLTEEDVLEILKKRCEVLKAKQGRYITPYDASTVKELYNMLNKNIRFAFKVLEDATIMSEADAPCRIAMNDLKIVQEKEKQKILSTLPDSQLKIITALLTKGQLMQKELSKVTQIGITNLTRPVKELEDKGLVVVKQGKTDKRVKRIKLSENSYLKFFFTFEKIKKK